MKIVRLIMKVLALLLLALALFTNQILPTTYLIGIGVVEVLLLLLVWKRKILQIFVVLVIITSSLGLMYSENIIARLVTYNPLQVNSISFFTLKESPILTIKSGITKKIASSSLVEEELTKVIQTQLEKNGYTQTLGSFEGIYAGVEELYAKTIDILVMDEAYIDTVLTIDPDFLLKTKVIWAIKNTVERVPIVSEKDVLTESFTVLIAGNDNFGPLQVRSLTDIDMLMTINPITRTIKMVSVPRDSYLSLNKEACGINSRVTNTLDKLTHAGTKSTGVNCVIGTLEDAFNIKIDYYLQLNFSSFWNIINAIGEITVYNEEAFTEDNSLLPVPYRYAQGMITINRDNATAYVRQRHGFTYGDLQRIKNQQEVIKGMVKKLTELSTLTKIESIVKAIQGTIDTNMLPAEVMAIARSQIQNLSLKWELSSYVLTGKSAMEGTFTQGYENQYYVLKLDTSSIAAARKALVDNMIIPEKNND